MRPVPIPACLGRWVLLCLLAVAASQLCRAQSQGPFDGEYIGGPDEQHELGCWAQGICFGTQVVPAKSTMRFTIRGNSLVGTIQCKVQGYKGGSAKVTGKVDPKTGIFKGRVSGSIGDMKILEPEEFHGSFDRQPICGVGHAACGLTVDCPAHPGDTNNSVDLAWCLTRVGTKGQTGTDHNGGTGEVSKPKTTTETSSTSSGHGAIGLGGIGKLPGPDTTTQAITGIVLPALLSALAGLLGAGLAGGTPIPTGGTGPVGGTDGSSEGLSTEEQDLEDKVKQARDEQDAQDYKEKWLQQRQDDVRALTEEKAHLEAVIAGAQLDGFDTSEHVRRLNQLNRRLDELHRQLDQEGADITYVAEDRGVIRSGQEFTQAEQQNEALKRQADQIDYLNKLQQEAIKQGLWNTGGTGDMAGQIQGMKDSLLAGESVNPDKLEQIQKILRDHLSGRAATQDKLPDQEHFGGWLNSDLLWDASFETIKNFGQCQTSDGKISWGGLLGRVAIDALTLGEAEPVFVTAGGMSAVKDNIDQGGDSFLSAWKDGAKEAAFQWLAGKAFEGGGRVLIGGVSGGFEGGVRGAVSGAKTAGQEFAEGLAQEGKDLIQGLGRGGDEVKGVWSGSGEGAATGDAPPPPKLPLNAEQSETLDKLKQAVKQATDPDNPDPKKLLHLYQEGGGKKLVELQNAGSVDDGLAKSCNRILKGEVNDCVDDATKKSVAAFKEKTGVDIKEVLVGDSGSGVKGDVIRLKTDADRTLLPRFTDESVDRYIQNAKADGRNISKADAVDGLSKEYKRIHDIEMDRALSDKGLSPNDVRYSSYDRIGANSGQVDAYGERTASCKQAADGVTYVYKVNADGSVRNPVKSSGQTIVDQSRLDKASLGDADALVGDSTKILPKDVPNYVKEQQAALSVTPDPVQAAKSVYRTDKGASILGDSLGDSDLTNASREIYKNPDRANEILKKYGFTDYQGNPDPDKFVTYSKFKINQYIQTLPPPTST